MSFCFFFLVRESEVKAGMSPAGVGASLPPEGGAEALGPGAVEAGMPNASDTLPSHSPEGYGGV